MVPFNRMDHAQRKRLADMCEKLGVMMFGGAILDWIVKPATTDWGNRWLVVVLLLGVAVLQTSLLLSKEDVP